MNTLAVVVTYNRKELLQECLQALLHQTNSDFKILVVDNGSSDGTHTMMAEYVGERIMYRNMRKNTGGAGGFSYAVKQACKLSFDYVWLMDDDTIPAPDCYEILVQNAERLGVNGMPDFSYLASMVKWTDGTPCVMNMTEARKDWYRYIDAVGQGLLPVQRCSFVSVLIPTVYVRAVGLPIRKFFLYADDREYTERLGRVSPGYMVMDSICVHKMQENVGVDIAVIPAGKLDRCFYDNRNRFYIARQNGLTGVLQYFWQQTKFACRILSSAPGEKKRRLWILLKGTLAGLVFFPRIERVR